MLDALWFTPTTCPTGVAFWVSTAFYGVLGTLLVVGAVILVVAAAHNIGRAYDALVPEGLQETLRRRWNYDYVGYALGGVVVTVILMFVLVLPWAMRTDFYYQRACLPICEAEGLSYVRATSDTCFCAADQVAIPHEPCG